MLTFTKVVLPVPPSPTVCDYVIPVGSAAGRFVNALFRLDRSSIVRRSSSGVLEDTAPPSVNAIIVPRTSLKVGIPSVMVEMRD